MTRDKAASILKKLRKVKRQFGVKTSTNQLELDTAAED